MGKNLIEGLFEEMNRVRELIKEYESLPDNAGAISAALMKMKVQKAEQAIASGDVVAEIKIFEDLKGYTG